MKFKYNEVSLLRLLGMKTSWLFKTTYFRSKRDYFNVIWSPNYEIAFMTTYFWNTNIRFLK